MVRLFLGSKTGQNLLAMYGVQVANYVLPLLTLPYLARVLGPEKFGTLAIVQSLAQYFFVLIEYGFSLTATRDVARFRDDKARLVEIVSGVLGTRFLMSVGVFVLAILLSQIVGVLQNNAALLWAGVFWAIVQGMNPIWYFQGHERMRKISALEILTKLLGFLGILTFVKHPDDVYKVLLIQGLASALVLILSWRWILSEVGYIWPNYHRTKIYMQSGWSIFASSMFVNLYTSANNFILGVFVPPQQVAYFAGAEKITRAVISLLQPLIRIFLSRFSYLVEKDLKAALALLEKNTLLFLVIGVIGTISVWIAAPLAVKLLLGKGYEPSVAIMYILSLIIIPVSLASVWGTQWMIANGLDRLLLRIYMSAGLLNIFLAFVLVPKMGSIGLAVGVVVVEVFGASMMWFALQRRGMWIKRR